MCKEPKHFTNNATVSPHMHKFSRIQLVKFDHYTLNIRLPHAYFSMNLYSFSPSLLARSRCCVMSVLSCLTRYACDRFIRLPHAIRIQLLFINICIVMRTARLRIDLPKQCEQKKQQWKNHLQKATNK